MNWFHFLIIVAGPFVIPSGCMIFLSGSYRVKLPNPPLLIPMDFLEILSGESIHQEMKIVKMLTLYHVQFRDYDHPKYGPFSWHTKPLKFLPFYNCF